MLVDNDAEGPETDCLEFNQENDDEKPYMGEIERWFKRGEGIAGYLFRNTEKKYREGQYIHTRKLLDVVWDKKADCAIIETEDGIYTLGQKGDV